MSTVAMSYATVNSTPAEKVIIAGLVLLVFMTLAIWVTRRRGEGPKHT